MKIKGKIALVTGAGGFIGSHLVEQLLDEGVRVKALLHYNSRNDLGNLIYLSEAQRSEIEIVFGDITDNALIRSLIKGCDIVFHLAALIGIPYSYVAPYSYANTNIHGSMNIFQACSDLGIEKLVHTSTSESYGTAQYVPIDEKHPLQGQSPYAASKISADFLAESYYRSFGLPVATIRPFNTFGPRQSRRAVIPTVLSQLLSGVKELHVGSLEPIRDFNYIKDTVKGFIAMAKCDASVGKLINIGSGHSISIGDFIQLSLEKLGIQVEIKVDGNRVRPEKSEVVQLVCDNRLAAEILNWSPAYTFEQGLLETIDFIKNNLSTYYSLKGYII